jgi:hypothetical protein
MGKYSDCDMNIGDYLKALEETGVKFITTSNIGQLKDLYCKHVLPKPQRECFKVHHKNKRTSSGASVGGKVKRIKIVRKDCVVKEVKTSATNRISTAPSSTDINADVNSGDSSSVSNQDSSSKAPAAADQNLKPNLKRLQFSEDVSVLTYKEPKFKKTAVSWP